MPKVNGVQWFLLFGVLTVTCQSGGSVAKMFLRKISKSSLPVNLQRLEFQLLPLFRNSIVTN
jgi:hypothetical protein